MKLKEFGPGGGASKIVLCRSATEKVIEWGGGQRANEWMGTPDPREEPRARPATVQYFLTSKTFYWGGGD